MSFAFLFWMISLVLPLLQPARTPPESEAPPASADEVVFRPSGTIHPRKPQIIQGRRTDAAYDFIELSVPDVASAAQIYADFSKREVRVPRSLVTRKLRMGQGSAQAAASHVTDSLAMHLSVDGVEVVKVGRGVVAFRPGKTFEEKVEGMVEQQRLLAATPAERAAAEAAMSSDRFWAIIDVARRRGGNRCQGIVAALEVSLRGLSADEIMGFHLRFEQRRAESYRWDLWGVAYLVNGGASDDGFEYFRAWLVAQGRDYFETAMKDAARAAERADRSQRNECEALLYVATEAFTAKTGRPMPQIQIGWPAEPGGRRWTEEELPRLFPELARKFR